MGIQAVCTVVPLSAGYQGEGKKSEVEDAGTEAAAGWVREGRDGGDGEDGGEVVEKGAKVEGSGDREVRRAGLDVHVCDRVLVSGFREFAFDKSAPYTHKPI
jgi:hypothetical protein